MRKISMAIHAGMALVLLIPAAVCAAAADAVATPEVAANVAKFRTFGFVQGDPKLADIRFGERGFEVVVGHGRRVKSVNWVN